MPVPSRVQKKIRCANNGVTYKVVHNSVDGELNPNSVLLPLHPLAFEAHDFALGERRQKVHRLCVHNTDGIDVLAAE